MTSVTKLLATTLLLFACSTPDGAMADSTKAKARPAPATKEGPREVAILGGGCFWGMEWVMNLAPGVVSVDVGYAGGRSTKVTYDEVTTGKTGHAEAVRVVFDPTVITYEELLLQYYFRGHNPTHLDHQNNDIGPQYRSVIFTLSKEQAQTARAARRRVEQSGKWKDPIVTAIEPASTWVEAEAYHQDYLVKHPDGYNDHFLRDFTY